MEESTIELLPQISETSVLTNIKDVFQQGIESYQNDDIDTAAEIFSSIIGTNPEFPEAHVNLGNTFFKQNKIAEAINCWKKALSIDSTQVICYVNIGNAHYLQKNIEEALSHWHVAITMAPDHPIALMNLGSAYETTGDLSNAFVYYEQYLKYCSKTKSGTYNRIHTKVMHSKKVSLHNLNVGVYFQKRNELRKAAIAYIKSIQTYPNFPKAHLNMGSICYMAEKLEDAVKYWLQAVNLDPEYGNTYCNLGIAYDRLNQYSKSFCMYSRYLSRFGIKSSETANIQERLAALKKYLDKHPELAQKHLSDAEEHYRKRRYNQALWEYENYAILRPDDRSSYESKINELNDITNPVKKAAKVAIDIGNACLAQHKYDKAITSFKRYLYLEPKGKQAEHVHKKITECSMLMGKVAKAFIKSDKPE